MPDAPRNQEEFNARYMANCSVTGYGLEVAQNMACPFCAAPGFMTMPIMDATQAMEKGGECQECGRAMKAIVVRDDHGVRFEMIQTAGDPAPEWMQPQMRREIQANPPA